ncbi:MAG: AIM24 family protein [Lachnospiraceae bacterium]|nr:AIM24 family protein [Lachnospiraceae bacterium]
MLKLETVNELTLKVTADAGDILYTKAGSFISGECYGQKNFQFEKMLLGPGGTPVAAALGQLTRRFTGENLPLMKVSMRGQSITYYANEAQHVVVIPLQYGETLSIESENILAFTPDCKYSVRFLASGVISQKGLATSTLTAQGPNAQVAVLIDGNPIVMSNMQSGNTIEVDPDAVVCWAGQGNSADPGFKLDLSWKNIIGQASGESYMMEWGGNRRATIIVQPNERKSGVNIGMDGGSSGQRASRQQNQTLGQAGQSIGQTLGGLGDMLGGGQGGMGGLGGIIGGIF